MENRERLTPWDVVFGAAPFDGARFERLRVEAEGRDVTSPTELFMLPAAGELLRDLLPAGDAAAHRERVAQVSALMFHGFRFWLAGQRILSVGESALRELLTRRDTVGGWSFRVPGEAGYVQLAAGVLWARVAEDAPAEPVDGFFWSAPGEPAAPLRLDILLCLGVRRGRPGISLVEVAVEAGEALQHWADAEARPDGADFANVLPGGELRDYHSLVTQAEVIKLAVRCFWYLDTDGEPDLSGAGERHG